MQEVLKSCLSKKKIRYQKITPVLKFAIKPGFTLFASFTLLLKTTHCSWYKITVPI